MMRFDVYRGPRYNYRVEVKQPADGAASRSISLLRTMLRSRTIEERLVRLYHQGKLYGGVYTSMGQEGTGAAAAFAGGPDDLYAPCIRSLALHLGRGETTINVFRQWLGRREGPTRGRDGNIHFGSMDRGVYAMISHLGAMLPVVVGGVMGRRYRGVDSVGFAFIGDGGSSTGDFHEAINFSAVQEVPVIFIIEDNHYAYSTPTRYQYRCRDLVDRAAGYGIEGIKADGNDPLAMYEMLKSVAEDIRVKPRTVLVVADTMRMRGHGEHDDFSYVPRELLEKYRRHDPIDVCAAALEASGVLDRDGLEAMRTELLAEIDAAYKQALSERGPDFDGLVEDVYEPV